MREFNSLRDKKLISLLDAFKLDSQEAEDGYSVAFYIGSMNDCIITVDSFDDGSAEVTTYSGFRAVRAITEIRGRDLSNTPSRDKETLEKLAKIVMGCYERFLKLKLKERLANARA